METKELAVVQERSLTAGDVRKQVNLIQTVMKNVMKKDVHYGIISGCDKPSLYKPGAEKLMMTFRLAAEYEELPGSTEEDGFIMYKINCRLIHIPTGLVVGNGRGTCNSKEKKYKTRSVYENKATDEEKEIGKLESRESRKGGKFNVYIVPQDPWDIQNTIYKMSCKRANSAAVLNATAASDIFTQDIEDLPEGTVLEDDTENPNIKPDVKQPQSKKETKAKSAAKKKTESKKENKAPDFPTDISGCWKMIYGLAKDLGLSKSEAAKGIKENYGDAPKVENLHEVINQYKETLGK